MTALVVLPGLDGTATLLTRFAAAARPAFASVTCVAYPPRGPQDERLLETHARAALPAEAPFVLLGESFSGPIAIAIAADPPPNLVGVVLSTTYARAPVPWLAPLSPLLRRLPLPQPPTAVLAWWLLGRWQTPALRRALDAALASVPSATLRARAAVALDIDVRDRLPRIRPPVLVLRASGDRLLSPRCGERLAAAIAQAALVDIAGPHLLLQTAAAPCAAAIAAFAAPLPAATLGDTPRGVQSDDATIARR